MKTPLLFLVLCLYSYVSSAQTEAHQYDATVAHHYFDFSLKLVKETPGFSPPVPAIDHISIHSLDIRQGTSYTVLDITGRKWQRGVLANETTVVSIDALAPGLYFLLVDSVYPATIRFTKS
jgi:hypothetical protein